MQRRGESKGTHKLLVAKRCARDRAFGGEGVGGARDPRARGSRPPALGEDTLLQLVVARRFGVGKRDVHALYTLKTRSCFLLNVFLQNKPES
jgi:hypothetical protein